MKSKDDRFRVEWVNLGEGWSGDYDPDDPEDENLLRFDCYVHNGEIWEDPGDASYCTRMPANTDPRILRRVIKIILERFADTYAAHSYKRALEELSWLCPDDFKEEEKKNE